jgi:diphthine methyl ester synthase
VGCCRLGQPTQRIVAGRLEDLRAVDFGEPLHCLVVCGPVHPLEEELLRHFRLPTSTAAEAAEGQGQGGPTQGSEERDQPAACN